MNAKEWIHFIDPFIIVAIVMALMASLPVSANLSKTFQLTSQKLAGKKTIFTTVALMGIGWLLAHFALMTTTPLIRVNLIAASQLICVLALIATAILLFIRIIQKNNLLALCFILIKRYFPGFVRVFGFLASFIVALFVESLDENTFAQQEKEAEQLSDEDKVLRLTHTNYRGEYCDENKSNWY